MNILRTCRTQDFVNSSWDYSSWAAVETFKFAFAIYFIIAFLTSKMIQNAMSNSCKIEVEKNAIKMNMKNKGDSNKHEKEKI